MAVQNVRHGIADRRIDKAARRMQGLIPERDRHIEAGDLTEDLRCKDEDDNRDLQTGREDNVAEIYKGINALLPTEFAKYRLQLRTNRGPLLLIVCNVAI